MKGDLRSGDSASADRAVNASKSAWSQFEGAPGDSFSDCDPVAQVARAPPRGRVLCSYRMGYW
jgi:hypothetical protein